MTDRQSAGEISLADGQSALAVLDGLLRAAADAHPQTFGGIGLPETLDALRKAYPDVLPRFEAARLADPQRHDIAREMVRGM